MKPFIFSFLLLSSVAAFAQTKSADMYSDCSETKTAVSDSAVAKAASEQSKMDLQQTDIQNLKQRIRETFVFSKEAYSKVTSELYYVSLWCSDSSVYHVQIITNDSAQLKNIFLEKLRESLIGFRFHSAPPRYVYIPVLFTYVEAHKARNNGDLHFYANILKDKPDYITEAVWELNSILYAGGWESIGREGFRCEFVPRGDFITYSVRDL